MSTEQVAYNQNNNNQQPTNLPRKSSLDKIRSKVKNIFSHKDNHQNHHNQTNNNNNSQQQPSQQQTSSITKQLGSLTTEVPSDPSSATDLESSIFSPTHTNHTDPSNKSNSKKQSKPRAPQNTKATKQKTHKSNNNKNSKNKMSQQQPLPLPIHQQTQQLQNMMTSSAAHPQSLYPHHHTNQISSTQSMYPQQGPPQMIANHHYATQSAQQTNYINHPQPHNQPQPHPHPHSQMIIPNQNALYSMGINNPKVQNRLQALNSYSHTNKFRKYEKMLIISNITNNFTLCFINFIIFYLAPLPFAIIATSDNQVV